MKLSLIFWIVRSKMFSFLRYHRWSERDSKPNHMFVILIVLIRREIQRIFVFLQNKPYLIDKWTFKSLSMKQQKYINCLLQKRWRRQKQRKGMKVLRSKLLQKKSLASLKGTWMNRMLKIKHKIVYNNHKDRQISRDRKTTAK